VAFEITYEIETPPAPAWNWEQYARLVETRWDALLSAAPAPSEAEVQHFLEQHPSLIPGAFCITTNSGHYPALCGVIRQAPLPSYSKRVPDFIWLAGNSGTDQPVLVEIEAPSKKWFTKKGQPTAGLTQALDQIADWKAWFAVPHNVQAFKSFYGLEQWNWRERYFRPAFVLIYGRRSEANASPELTRKRAHLASEDIVIMTYDRLKPDPNCDYLCCLEAHASSRFRVVSVPPTLEWVPGLARERAHSQGWDEAIDLNEEIDPVRKQFLKRRRPYWEKWTSTDGSRVTNSRDKE